MRYFILDVETVGLHVPDEGSGVVEFCAFEVDDELNTIKTYHSIINPEAPISAGATATHGIKASDVINAPTLAEYFLSLDNNPWGEGESEFAFIAHNAKFDEKWLKDYIFCDYVLVDSLKLARQFYPDAESHKLQVLRVILDLPFDIRDAHSADGDVETLLNFMRRLSQDTGKTLDELCIEAQKKGPLPTTIKFGKHSGRKIADVAKDYPDYLDWCLKNLTHLSAEYQEAFERALKNK
ncbi:3'-5' exonuclease [Oligella sp. HMSC09E12]|uniref:3'-5' exonuclease n=1 Tax=Oligella sp. HMSC09E12 TaxID=1581147 RepID=UPI0008A51FF8|nr:3'-5' exonuclease [Oligella sp. HMSC09E12]OFV49733.1 hypothetical protein HMPREF3179_03740 [Oligella sp. HMSC09E12]